MKKIITVFAVMLVSASLAFAADDTFSKLDKSKDGKISSQEYKDAAARTFDKLDKNSDGILSREEIMSNKKIDGEKMIKTIDPGSEEKIVKKMYLQAAEKEFKSLDKNKDGYIDIKEWKISRPTRNQPMLVIFTF